MTEQSVFWEDLAEDLRDPEFLREFILEAVRIKTVDSIVNALDQARRQSDLTKATLARAVSAEPASVRRLFSNPKNPTLHTVSELAASLGYRLTLEPLAGPGREAISGALINGSAVDLAELEAGVDQFDKVAG
ncbi:XRE family transcriptional regulator [Nocardia sp. NPDC058480]|uniref:XRE family transcriptional regulator n=1 Tax=Nocardia sp. NPDC058480 TaxID=3346522 RepID=UPI0036525804